MNYQQTILLIFGLLLFKITIGQKITLEREPKKVSYFSTYTVDYFYYKHFKLNQGITYTTTQGISAKQPKESTFYSISMALGGSISPNSKRFFLEDRLMLRNNITVFLFDIGQQFGYNEGLHVMLGCGVNFRIFSIFNLCTDIGMDYNTYKDCGIVFLRMGLMLKKHFDRKSKINHTK